MDAWLSTRRSCAVGIYISGDSRACRNQPNLTPTWVSTQLAKRLAAAADHPRPAGLLPAAVPALRRRRPTINPSPGTNGRYATARKQGTRRGRPSRRRRQGARHRRRAARSGTTSRASTPPTPTAASPRWRSFSAWTQQIHALGYVSGVYSSAGSGIEMLDDARVEPARRLHPARPDLDRPLGRRRQHLHVVHPRRRLAARRPGEAVPGRPRRDLGRRHDQHRPQLPRPRPGLGRRAGDRTAAASPISLGELPALEPATATARPTPARSRRCSACSRSRASTPARSTASTTSATDRRRQRLADRPRLRAAADAGRRRHWMSLLSDGAAPGAQARLGRPGRYAASSGPSTRPARTAAAARRPASSNAATAAALRPGRTGSRRRRADRDHARPERRRWAAVADDAPARALRSSRSAAVGPVSRRADRPAARRR